MNCRGCGTLNNNNTVRCAMRCSTLCTFRTVLGSPVNALSRTFDAYTHSHTLSGCLFCTCITSCLNTCFVWHTHQLNANAMTFLCRYFGILLACVRSLFVNRPHVRETHTLATAGFGFENSNIQNVHQTGKETRANISESNILYRNTQTVCVCVRGMFRSANKNLSRIVKGRI